MIGARAGARSRYCEIGGAGGPAAAAGAGGGAEAVTARRRVTAARTAAGGGRLRRSAGRSRGDRGEAAGGAGVTGGTGSARSTGVSPLPVSFGASILADSDLPSPDGLVPSGLPLVCLGGFGSWRCRPWPARPWRALPWRRRSWAALRRAGLAAAWLSLCLAASICGRRGRARSPPGPEPVPSAAGLASSGPPPPAAWPARLPLRPCGVRLRPASRGSVGLGPGGLLRRRRSQPAAMPVELLGRRRAWLRHRLPGLAWSPIAGIGSRRWRSGRQLSSEAISRLVV